MSSEASVLERRIGQIESRNRRLRWLIVALVIFTIVASAWAQGTSHPAVKATKFELYDEAGHLRAELALSDGKPCLRLFGDDGTMQSVLTNDRLTLQAKEGGQLAIFGKDGLRFEDGQGKTFLALTANYKEQRGELHLNDLRAGTNVVVTGPELGKLIKSRAQ